MARTQQDRKAETRRRLLRAAAELFAREGYDAVSVDAIGEAAGRTSGSVYAHFGGKQGLLLALLEGFQDDLAAVVQAEFATRDTLEGRLRGLWDSLGHHPDDDGWFLLEVELWLQTARTPEHAGPLAARYLAIHDLMRDEFCRWVTEFGLRPPMALDQLPQGVMAALIGLYLRRELGQAA